MCESARDSRASGAFERGRRASDLYNECAAVTPAALDQVRVDETPVRRWHIADPANPRLTGQLWLGGLLGKPSDAGRELNGGPQMLQLSLDGRRLYVTNSLYSTWDNQFYPELRSWLLKVDIGEDGSMAVDPDFFIDFSDRPDGPARAHEMRLQGGDSTSEVFA